MCASHYFRIYKDLVSLFLKDPDSLGWWQMLPIYWPIALPSCWNTPASAAEVLGEWGSFWQPCEQPRWRQTTSSTGHEAAKAAPEMVPIMQSASRPVFEPDSLCLASVHNKIQCKNCPNLERCCLRWCNSFHLFLNFDSMEEWTNRSQGLRHLREFDFGKACLEQSFQGVFYLSTFDFPSTL